MFEDTGCHVAVTICSAGHASCLVVLAGEGEHCSSLDSSIVTAEKHAPATRHESITQARYNRFNWFADNPSDMFVISCFDCSSDDVRTKCSFVYGPPRKVLRLE